MAAEDVLSGEPAYARFSRRVQAVCIDSIVIMLIMVAALIAAISLASDHIARILGFVFVATWLLYEPLLVTATGGTVGHHLCNIRVVDDRTGGNIGFVRAVLRTVIKAFLGWYSFVTMVTTSRYQAIHDLATRSSVQIRDMGKARAYHFHTAREPLPPTGVPSRGRRVTVTLAYLIGAFGLNVGLQIGLAALGLVSMRCFDGAICSPRENTILDGVALGWLAISVLLIAAGWRGWLWGARRARQA